MRRLNSKPRPQWQRKVEEAGLLWHSGITPYWTESAFYEFTAAQVDELETATNELWRISLEAAEYVIDNKLYSRLAIPDHAIPLIERSWEKAPPSLYGRFDFAFDGVNPVRLLEFNADTPTSLLEASVVQWYWLQEVALERDQFNSLHERLIERWKELSPYLPDRHIDFCSLDDLEDGATVTYLLDTARQAGLDCMAMPITEIGWNGTEFARPDGRPLSAVFKLYPWEWMIHEEFGKYIGLAKTLWIEPAWKMLLSNKGILPMLWELFPGHPNLLEARFGDPGSMSEWVRKPLLSREGASVTLHRADTEIHTEGEYGEEGFVYQAIAPLGCFEGKY